MKTKSDDGALPEDPNSVTSGRAPDSSESANRPSDVNDVTSNKSVGSSESDNRPAKPGV